MGSSNGKEINNYYKEGSVVGVSVTALSDSIRTLKCGLIGLLDYSTVRVRIDKDSGGKTQPFVQLRVHDLGYRMWQMVGPRKIR